ncbi:MAG TPA: sensor histidine kinase [Spirochaetales bacterium]|nr:sensor histidine kinase [Spirochaetales bacterium]HRY53762.1 sensor histidine kinase [Spirochaetia bacterium]HRZ65591.1 sensor histidine kinase [Spirochaetia bacterium]
MAPGRAGSPRPRSSNRNSVLRVVLPYFFFGAAWILFSDRLILPLAASAEDLLWLSTAKGWLFILVTAALLASLVLGELGRRSRLEAELLESLAEKEVLLAEVNHRVKNNLQVMASILELESEGIRGDEARRQNLDTRNRLRSLSLVHEQLYAAKGLARIRLDDYLRDLVGTMPESCSPRGACVDYELEPLEAGPDIALSFGLFATEAVSNALRHGAGADGSPELFLSLRADERGSALFCVRDRGPGLPEGAARRGLGFQLMGALAEQLRGELSIANEGGAVIRLRFAL